MKINQLHITCRFKIYTNIVCGNDKILYQLEYFKRNRFHPFKKLTYNDDKKAYRINGVWVTRKRLLNLRIETKEILNLEETLLSNNLFY